MEDSQVGRLINRLAHSMAQSLVAALYEWQAAVGREFLAAGNARVAALEGRIEQLAHELEDQAPSARAAQQTVSALQAQVGEMTVSVNGRVEALARQIGGLQDGLGGLQSHLQGMGELLQSCVGQLNRQAESIREMRDDGMDGKALADEILNLVTRMKTGRSAAVAKVRAALEDQS